MTPHQTDRVATQIINLLVAVVVLILLFLLGDIIISGLPHISWHFLTSPSSSFSAGGGIRDQLFNSLYLLVLTWSSRFHWHWVPQSTYPNMPVITGLPASFERLSKC